MAKHFWSEHSLSFFFFKFDIIRSAWHVYFTHFTVWVGHSKKWQNTAGANISCLFFFSLTSVETRITCKHFSTLVEYSDFRSGLTQFALENLTSHIIWMSPYGPRSQKTILKNHAEFKTWQFSPRIFILK